MVRSSRSRYWAFPYMPFPRCLVGTEYWPRTAERRIALWEGREMAAPGMRGLSRVARGWRQFEGLRASSLGSRSLTLAAKPSDSRSPWRLLGAVCLQRPPLVSKPLTPLQEEMAALLQQVGWSCKSWLQGAVGEPIKAREPRFDSDSGITSFV